MKLSEELAKLIDELEASNRRIIEATGCMTQAADRIIQSVDRMVKED